jgi:hypothetical protein
MAITRIITPAVTDDAVTLDKMAPGTDGNLITYDASGNPVAVATGTAGQVLTSAGAGAPPTFAEAGGGNTELISHTTLDGTGANTITTTTDWSSNNYYKIEVFLQYDMDVSAGSTMRLRNASGDISTDSYQYFIHRGYDLKDHSNFNDGWVRDLNGSKTELEINGWGWITGYTQPNLRLTVYKPDNNNRQFLEMNQHTVSPGGSSNPYFANYQFWAWCNNTDAKKGWSFIGNSSRNFINGTQTVVGYKYA